MGIRNMSRDFEELRNILEAKEAATTPYRKRKLGKEFDEKLAMFGWLKKIAPKDDAEDET